MPRVVVRSPEVGLAAPCVQEHRFSVGVEFSSYRYDAPFDVRHKLDHIDEEPLRQRS